MAAMWLMHCLNCQLSQPNCYSGHYTVISFQPLILEPVFCGSLEAWEADYIAFLQTSEGRGCGVSGLFWECPIGLITHRRCLIS